MVEKDESNAGRENDYTAKDNLRTENKKRKIKGKPPKGKSPPPSPPVLLREESERSAGGDEDHLDLYYRNPQPEYDDEEEDEFDQDEDDEDVLPRWKYSTVDLADGGCRDTRCCLVAMGVFFVLIAIVVSVFYGGGWYDI